jgi:hypothetical protein
MAKEYTYQPFSIPRPSKINPNLDFWFENKPSGNPDMYIHYEFQVAKVTLK